MHALDETFQQRQVERPFHLHFLHKCICDFWRENFLYKVRYSSLCYFYMAFKFWATLGLWPLRIVTKKQKQSQWHKDFLHKSSKLILKKPRLAGNDVTQRISAAFPWLLNWDAFASGKPRAPLWAKSFSDLSLLLIWPTLLQTPILGPCVRAQELQEGTFDFSIFLSARSGIEHKNKLIVSCLSLVSNGTSHKFRMCTLLTIGNQVCQWDKMVSTSLYCQREGTVMAPAGW